MGGGREGTRVLNETCGGDQSMAMVREAERGVVRSGLGSGVFLEATGIQDGRVRQATYGMLVFLMCELQKAEGGKW